MKKYIYLLSILLLVGCKASQKTSADSRYRRQPIVEVSQQQLDIEAMMVSAKMQQEAGNSGEAMQQYAKILAKDPSYAPACYEVSRIYSMESNLDSALYYAKKATDGDGTNVWYLRQLADIYGKRVDMKNYSATWESIVRQQPEVVDNYYELSNAYLLSHDIPSAISTLDRVEKKVGVNEMTSLQKQRLWEAYGRSDKAQAEIEKLSAAMPQETKYSAILAESCMKQKDYKKAKVYYDRILAADPDDQYIHISLASYYKAVNDPDKAYEELKAGFANTKLDPTTKLQILATFYPNEEFYGKSSKYTFPLMDEVMSQCTDKSQYALFYGDILMRQNKYAEAADQFEVALAKDSSQYEVWEALLVCLSSGKDTAKTLDYAARAVKLFPLHVLPYFIQGEYAFEHRNYGEAVEKLQMCDKVGFPNGYLQADTYQLLSYCLIKMDRWDEAFAAYDRYLAIRPDDVEALNNYAYELAEHDGSLDHAEQMSKKAVAADPKNASYLDTYAWILHKLGRDKEALEYAQKAVAIEPANETLKKHLNTIKSSL